MSDAKAAPEPQALAAVAHRSLHALDRMERDSTGDRLAVVADLVAHAVGLPGWSAFSDGHESGAAADLVLRHLLRPTVVAPEALDVRLGPLVDGFGQHATLTSGPKVLRERMVDTELTEVLLIGGYAPDATRWVLECYADREAPPLVSLLPVMYTLVQAALSFPQPARPARGEQDGGLLSDLALVDPKANRSRHAE